MKRIFQYSITKLDVEKNLGQYLRAQGFSRHTLIYLKQSPENVFLNGEKVFLNRPLKEGDFIEIIVNEAASSENIVPTNLPIDIVYEDEDILILNKASNMPIHPSQGNYDNTLANALAYYYQQKGETFVYRCITRLDRDTTGLLIIAKNMVSASILSQLMVERQIHRTYLAIVEGIPSTTSGRIVAPIGRMDGSTIERCIDFENGDFAATNYVVLKSTRDYSLVQLKLETGRTHQIRVHMNYIGHPLPGDYLYHPVYDKITRQALHASELDFPHPITKKNLHFHAPLPEDMLKFDL